MVNCRSSTIEVLALEVADAQGVLRADARRPWQRSLSGPGRAIEFVTGVARGPIAEVPRRTNWPAPSEGLRLATGRPQTPPSRGEHERARQPPRCCKAAWLRSPHSPQRSRSRCATASTQQLTTATPLLPGDPQSTQSLCPAGRPATMPPAQTARPPAPRPRWLRTPLSPSAGSSRSSSHLPSLCRCAAQPSKERYYPPLRTTVAPSQRPPCP
jgi:hypothetical protein